MKMLLCTDIRIGAICIEKLDVAHSRKWKAARVGKFEDLLDRAVQNGAGYVALFGKLFGQNRISETVIDQLFSTIKKETQIHVLAFLSTDEVNRITYRNDIPPNLHLICMQSEDTYTDDNIALRNNKGTIEIQLEDHAPICISESAEGGFVLGSPEGTKSLPSFEPIGFEDAEDRIWGYGLLEWSAEKKGSYITTENQKYNFKTIELRIIPTDGQKQILRKIDATMRNIAMDTFLRITITGRSAFGLILNSDAIKEQLQKKVFFVEVYDNTIMDIDEEAFEHDISLSSEFVRLALRDDSLSESERSRLISCGWNVLNGKEVSEQ